MKPILKHSQTSQLVQAAVLQTCVRADLNTGRCTIMTEALRDVSQLESTLI
jgi:hypothetical protein